MIHPRRAHVRHIAPPKAEKRGTTPEEWAAITAAEPSARRAEEALAAALTYARTKRQESGGEEAGEAELSMEQLTLRQEKAKSEKGMVTEVQMLTKDGRYRPKVTTWGVFPRPENISATYGGGRTLRPGGQLEPKEATEERAKRLKAKMEKYKKNAGLEVEDVVLRKCEKEMGDGAALMTGGKLEAAVLHFTVVADEMPPKSRLAGEAVLQRAVCWDSLGRSEQAKQEYKKITMHPSFDVAKRARTMLEGFQSMEFLKADQFDFMTQRNAYGSYFESMSKDYRTGSWNSGYILPESEAEAEGMQPGIVIGVIAGLFLVPLGMVAVLVLAR